MGFQRWRTFALRTLFFHSSLGLVHSCSGSGGAECVVTQGSWLLLFN